MPDQPKTQHRSVRVPDDDWADFKVSAEDNGRDRAKVINEFIRWYLYRPGAELPSRPDRQPGSAGSVD